jgi:hypothetical protein
MTEIAPRKDKSNPTRLQVLWTLIAAGALLATNSDALAHEGPVLRSGLWKFERTLKTGGKPTDRQQTSGLLIARQITRCVNPTRALRSEFTALDPGFCKTRGLQETNGGYAFQKVCTGVTPIKTEIEVRSDSSYIEVNQGNLGKIPTKETVVANRIGDCHSKGDVR